MNSASEEDPPSRRRSTSELLCVPFLDTDTRHETERADALLKERGYSTWLITLLRRICAVGLWTQAFVWEEWHLDSSDVLVGYGALCLPLGLLTIWHRPLGITFITLGVSLIGLGVWLMYRRPAAEARR